MTQIAVFDRFYGDPDIPDVISQALGAEDEVIAHANTIGAAALALVAMSEGELPRPRAVIIGGQLKDDDEYLRYPTTITREVVVPSRGWFGRRTFKQQPVTTTLLPVPAANGTMVLPTSYRSPVRPSEVAQYAELLRSTTRLQGCTPHVLSHLTKLLLPNSGVKIFGVSSFSNMAGLPVDTIIKRDNPHVIARLREAITEREQPVYESLGELLEKIPGQNGEACRRIYADYKELFEIASGSSHNHQAWPGGYYDHVTDAMNTAMLLYGALSSARPLPFKRADALLVLFLHDLEKPFKYKIDEAGNLIDNPDIQSKAARAAKRLEVMQRYGIELNAEQANALEFVEGIRDDRYTPGARLMGELATLCHGADLISARLWYNHPLPEGQDQWRGAKRINPRAADIMLASEILQ